MSLPEDLKKFALDELVILSKIPSISFPGFDPLEVHRSAEATAALLKKSGFENVHLDSIDDCFPYVVGDLKIDSQLPTVLLYAHHDVQPPGREELWKSSPFEPIEREGRLYGRGTADDKAGILVHAAAAKFYGRKCPVNLKVIIEGEEEVGSNHLLPYLKAHQKDLKADVIVVTDTGNIKSGVPSLTCSLRGTVSVEIEVRSLKAPVHSGLWGGAVVDPTQVLVKMISALTDSKGCIQLKSVGKKVKLPKKLQKVPLTKQEFFEQSGALHKNSIPDDFISKLWYEPSFAINAIQASSEKLASNIICDRAFARIGIRITSREQSEKVIKELVKKLKSLAPKTVDLKLKVSEPNEAWSNDPQAPEHRWVFQAAETALEKAYGKKVVYMGCGASIPFIGPFEKGLRAPVITFGVEDPYTLAHSENESLLLSDFYKAIESEIEFFRLLAR